MIKTEDLRLHYTSWVALPSEGLATKQLWIWAKWSLWLTQIKYLCKSHFKLNALKFLLDFCVLILWGGGRGGYSQLASALMWSSEDTVQKPALSFYHVGLRNWTWRAGLAASAFACWVLSLSELDVFVIISCCYCIKTLSRRDFFPLTYYLTRITTKLEEDNFKASKNIISIHF